MRVQGHRESLGAIIIGQRMYYEIHGTGHPLVLLHGAFSAIGTSFGKLLPGVSRNHQVIAFELQAHGRTQDVERPLTLEGIADDVAAALHQLKIDQADVFGYSMGAGVALHLALRHPAVVRRLVLASVTYRLSGLHPGLMEGLANMTAKQMVGTPWHEEYTRIAPVRRISPGCSPKKHRWIGKSRIYPPRSCARSRRLPCSFIEDSDIVRPEHAVEMFRLLGGGIMGDTSAGLLDSQLAILPGTSHTSLVNRSDLLIPMIVSFLTTPPSTPPSRQ